MAMPRGVTDVARQPPRLWSRPRRARLYTADRHHPRARRATDLLLLIAASLALAVVVQAAEPPTPFEQALDDLFASAPDFLDILWRVGSRLLLLWALLLAVGALVRWRLAILRDLVVSCGAAAVGATVLGEVVLSGGSLGFWEALTQTDPPPSAVSLPLALAAAITVVASPHIARPYRSVSRWLLAVGSISLLCLEAATGTAAAIGLLCGVVAATLVHLALGSSAGLPSLEEVRQALVDLDVMTGPLQEATRQTAGEFLVDTADPDGVPLLVKVYGRDARDTQLVAKAWRTLWYRGSGSVTLSRMQQAEHEAFVTLLAERSGVHVDEVVRAGRSSNGDAVLVLRQPGVPLPEEGATGVDRGVVERMWDEVTALHDAGIAHGDLAPRRFRRIGDRVAVGGLAHATVWPPRDERQIDIAQLIVTTVLLVGIDEAVEVARVRLGAEGVQGVLPYLQLAGLGSQLRADVKEAELDLDDVRDGAARLAAIEPPPMAKLRRVSRAGLVRAGILALVAYLLISALSGIDFEEVLDELQGASWGVLAVALLLGQTPRLAQAESTRGACPRPVAYGPLVLLQFAITFVNLVIPSAAARVAVNIRFFQRQGIPPASAVSIGVIDGIGGFIVQLTILLVVLVLGVGDPQLDFDLDDVSSSTLLRILAAAAVVVVIAVLVVAVVPSLRRRVVEQVKPWIHEVGETLGSLRSPTKVFQILGGNLVAEVLFASTMALVLAAFGTWVPLGTLLVVNVGVSLFAGLMPVPGGIGVAEGALVVGLTAAGVDEATALSAAIAYRIVTFYLPPVWGAVAFRRLERTGFI
jgi:uncharacterized protein (TIRG00374 family)